MHCFKHDSTLNAGMMTEIDGSLVINIHYP
jgi:hypothetical protein